MVKTDTNNGIAKKFWGKNNSTVLTKETTSNDLSYLPNIILLFYKHIDMKQLMLN
jgi:hypothetical protein